MQYAFCAIIPKREARRRLHARAPHVELLEHLERARSITHPCFCVCDGIHHPLLVCRGSVHSLHSMRALGSIDNYRRLCVGSISAISASTCPSSLHFLSRFSVACSQLLHACTPVPHLLTHPDCAQIFLKSLFSRLLHALASHLQFALHERSTDITYVFMVAEQWTC